MHPAPTCPRRVAILDDNAADVRLMSLALQQHMPETEVVTAIGGDSAWRFVRGEGEFRDAPPVGLVFLDLRVGAHDGLDLVRHVRQNGRMPHVPIVVFSGSMNPEDVERSYRAGANAFVPKPTQLDEHDKVLEAVAAFWCGAAALPNHEVSPHSS